MSPSNNVTTDVTILRPGGPSGGCPDGSDDVCVKADVYRTVARGNPLPSFFGTLVGITTQDISATATAKVLHGNAAKCMRPFAILDKWDEYDPATNGAESEYAAGVPDPDWDYLTSTFDKYDSHSPENDLYVRPSICDPPDPNCPQGTGFRPFDQNGNVVDYGREIEIHTGAQDQTSAGWFAPVRLHVVEHNPDSRCRCLPGALLAEAPRASQERGLEGVVRALRRGARSALGAVLAVGMAGCVTHTTSSPFIIRQGHD